MCCRSSTQLNKYIWTVNDLEHKPLVPEVTEKACSDKTANLLGYVVEGCIAKNEKKSNYSLLSIAELLQQIATSLNCNSWWIVEDTFKTALCKKPFSIGKKVRPLLVIHIGRNKGKTRGLSTWVILASFYFKMFNGPYPASFLLYFRSFSNKHYKFYNKLMCKGPSSIQCWNSNPRPSEQQSYPVTSRPGPPPYKMIFVTVLLTKYKLTKA